jgi:phthalate 4,5-dioxygenase oxygenase subunit
MIVRTRRKLLAAARALRETGARPPGADEPAIFRDARSGYLVSDDQTPWQEVYVEQVAAAQHPSPIPLRAAE